MATKAAGNAVAREPSRKTPPAARKSRPESDNWDQRLGFLIHDVSRLRRTVFDVMARPMGVTRSQWWVLAHLSRHDGMIQSDLANVLDLGKAALGGLIDRLEATELVHRGSDDNDRRVKRVFLSPKGSQLVKEMTVLSHQLSEQMLQGLSKTSRHMLVDLMSQVKANLQTMKIANDDGNNSSDEAIDVDV
jgi:DNA-binding MarR family transcriptional regulator